jgi:hypothetical protein
MPSGGHTNDYKVVPVLMSKKGAFLKDPDHQNELMQSYKLYVHANSSLGSAWDRLNVLRKMRTKLVDPLKTKWNDLEKAYKEVAKYLGPAPGKPPPSSQE